MGLRIQTNTAAQNAHRQLEISDSSMAKSLERLSSGFRVNRAADDAAGLSMSNKFVSQIRSLGVASRNATQANSLLQIAEGGMDAVGNILTRLKELATQAASANNAANLTDINAEAGKMLEEINRIANATTFQGSALLTGYGLKTSNAITVSNVYGLDVSGAAAGTYSVAYTDATKTIKMTDLATNVSQSLTVKAAGGTYSFGTLGVSFKTSDADAQSTILSTVTASACTLVVAGSDTSFQIGETNGNNYKIGFQIDDVQTAALSVSGIDLSTAANARTAMDSIDNAITALSSSRADIGAIQNRLGYTSSNLAIAIENASSANSVIKDVDMAAEMTEFTKNQILVQAGTSMLAQANTSPQLMLSLFK